MVKRIQFAVKCAEIDGTFFLIGNQAAINLKILHPGDFIQFKTGVTQNGNTRVLIGKTSAYKLADLLA